MQISAYQFILAFVLSIFALSAVTPAQAAETYTVDKIHSAVQFKVAHKQAGQVFGRFNDFEGSYAIDRKNPANSSVELTIKAGSVDTGFEKRDQHLASPDFFNAKQFPTITFKSKKVKVTGKQTAQVTGDLTLLGQTKAVTAQVRHTGTNGDLAGFEASFKIKRSDWGMKFMVGPLGDEVEMVVAVEGAKK